MHRSCTMVVSQGQGLWLINRDRTRGVTCMRGSCVVLLGEVVLLLLLPPVLLLLTSSLLLFPSSTDDSSSDGTLVVPSPSPVFVSSAYALASMLMVLFWSISESSTKDTLLLLLMAGVVMGRSNIAVSCCDSPSGLSCELLLLLLLERLSIRCVNFWYSLELMLIVAGPWSNNNVDNRCPRMVKNVLEICF